MTIKSQSKKTIKKAAKQQPIAKKATAKKWVYLFDEVEQAEANVGGSWEGVRALLGGKGSGLADMTRAGVPVPPGFPHSALRIPHFALKESW